MDNVLDTATQVIGAIGGLGLASFTLVDAFKALPGGGPSRVGFRSISDLVTACLPDIPAVSGTNDTASDPMRTGRRIVLNTVESNWINGMALSDQKAVARSLVKLYMRVETAGSVARHLGVSAADLAAVAKVWCDGPAKDGATDPTSSVVGRIDLALTGMIDGAYQRADQRYRNVSKLLAGIVSIVIATTTGAVVFEFNASKIFLSFIAGLFAVPLAPIAKDLTSALQAGVKVAQALRK